MNKELSPKYLAGGDVGCLLVHGFSSCPFDIRNLSKAMHRKGCTVQEVLLPGHGTDYQDMARFGWTDWRAAVETALRQLQQQCRQVWVLGFSMGASLATVVAADYPVAGLVSISAPIWPRNWRSHFAPLLKYFVAYIPLGKARQFQFPSWRYQCVAVKNVADLMELIGVARKTLPRVQVPTLVIQGQADRTVKPRSAQYIFDRLGAGDKEIAMVAGGHMLLLEPGFKEVCQKVSEFIENRTGGNLDGCFKTNQ